MKNYVADRERFGRSIQVWDGDRDFTWLDPRPSQNIMNHSPYGFEWGYSGSGPSQLALAILFDLFSDHLQPEAAKLKAVSTYQAFKEAFIAPAHQDKFVIQGDDVFSWVEHFELNKAAS